MKVTVFSQVSIDGKLTFGSGYSSKELFQLFTQEDMEFIHRFRGQVDGIMVGKNTICTDNPFLTNRFETGKNPVRLVPTRTMDLPLDSNIFMDDERTIMITTEQGADEEKKEWIRSRGKEVIVCGQELVDFGKLFPLLEKNYGFRHLMVEGGGMLNWHVFDLDLVDEIILMQLPIIIGGASNISLVDGQGYNDLSYTKKFEVADIQIKRNYTLMRYVRSEAANELIS
ncbi:dihydrofolate reductase family protein [Paenibacillus alkaliterrae]|uniref:dihydrofolate reductase family protein n=1 Tax=Paenibacillus alkaliterrae TaxID=320909 RepID=UPI001F28B57B|nr:dihydrofolate reductase family protein [Paenibacillus alkaliterrae]MCF2941227.1 dihydrofolate reductase family protein [Paenibacillus alkaliterrae]